MCQYYVTLIAPPGGNRKYPAGYNHQTIYMEF